MPTATNTLGRFREANDYLNDPQALNAIIAEEGYLFFRGVLDGVDRAKCDFVRILQQQGAVEPGISEPIWNGKKRVEEIDDTELYRAHCCAELFESSHNVEIFQRIFGEPIFVFKNPTVRYALPNDREHVSPPHQDYFFVRFNKIFRTFWIPLMDIEEAVGGLALAPGVHKRGLLDHVELQNVYSYVFRGRKQKGIPIDKVPAPWATADYHPGDLLVFHNLMVHWALPNRSDKIRLSIDNRCAPLNAPRTWQAERSILDARQFRAAAQQIALEEGASQEFFEEIMIELMGRDLEPGRSQIKALMEELRSHNALSRASQERDQPPHPTADQLGKHRNNDGY